MHKRLPAARTAGGSHPPEVTAIIGVATVAVLSVAWLLKGRGGEESQETLGEGESEEEVGEITSVELPSNGKNDRGFQPPVPLKNSLVHVTVKASLKEVWAAMFSNGSSMLADFHRQIGDRSITQSQWMKQGAFAC
jgi:hypothetical protein